RGGEGYGGGETKHASLVERASRRVVLLAVNGPGARSPAHDDARLGPVHTGLPGVACADQATVLPFERVLAHVPDVSALVLRVPVERALDRSSVLGNRVAHDRAANPEYPLDLTRHDHVVRLPRPVFNPSKVKRGAGPERQVTVVDGRDEVRRIDRGRILAVEDPTRGPRRGRRDTCG